MIRIIIFDELKFYKKIPQLDSFDFIQLLNIVGGLDYYYLSKLRTKFEDNIDQWIGFIKVYAEKSGYTTIKKIQSSFLKGLEFIEAEKYEELVYFLWKELIWQSDYFINNPSFNELKLFIDMLNKQIEIRQFFSKKPLVDFIHSLLKGDLSDRPDKIIDKNSDTLKLITIQRLCEINLTTPIQIWFDITSDSWQKSDNNNVYNYQLISPNWLESMRWTPQLEMDLIDLKLARLTKKTINLCSKKAYFLASESNIHGSLQTFDVLKNFLVTYTD